MLIEAFLKSSLLLLTAFAAARLLRSRPAALRHYVWLLALAGLVLLPAAGALAPAALPMDAGFVFASASSVARAFPSGPQWSSWAAALWLAGAAAFLLRLGAALLGVRSLTRSSGPALPSIAGIEVRLSDRIAVPITAGLFRRRILLPASAGRWPAGLQAVALQHELAHAERRDCLWQILAEIVCCLYWFQPLAWLAAAQARKEAEHACDDRVLATGANPAEYAAHLLSLARNLPSLAGLRCVPAMARQSGLEARLRAILNRARNRHPSSPRARVALACAAAFCILLVSGVKLPAQTDDQPRRAGDKDVTPPRVLSKTEPKYTNDARHAHVQGIVVLIVEVGTDGRVHNVRVKKSLDPGLDANALKAVEKWRFAPGRVHDKPVAVLATIEMNFRLK